MPVLTFDEASHQYQLDGRWIPGVTRILADSGYLRGAEWFTEESRIRGRQVHLACQWADQYAPEATTVEEVLEVIDLAEPIHPYLAGYLLFKREKGYVPKWHEKQLHLAAPLVAGTPDSWGHYADGRRVLVDLKSWRSQGVHPQRSAVIQTAGYTLMVKERLGLDTDLRVILKLSGDGRYRSYDCPNHDQDEFLFLCAVHTYHDRLAHKLVDRGDRSEVEIAA